VTSVAHREVVAIVTVMTIVEVDIRHAVTTIAVVLATTTMSDVATEVADVTEKRVTAAAATSRATLRKPSTP